MNNELIMVDKNDNPIGKISKQEAHEKPILHRAFSVFLFHDNKILIQQRAFHKYHSGGLWANTCCSHPRTDDIVLDAKERLVEEVGIHCDNLKEIYKFIYLTKFNEHLYEHEFDHVLVGEYNGDFVINPNEVNDMKWIGTDELKKELELYPEKYSSWFKICAPVVIRYIENLNK
ncbi:MAG: isopentenyl-diphosphate Delta-isomerase [Clostridia bacterium]|nr:isopentenyl-diphosphate Delta-isomerase [Clostridia bacterium]